MEKNHIEAYLSHLAVQENIAAPIREQREERVYGNRSTIFAFRI